MDRYELQIAIDEAIAHELLWHALIPEGMVMTPALNQAIARQQLLRGCPAEGYRIAGVSVTHDQGVLRAALEFARLHEQALGT